MPRYLAPFALAAVAALTLAGISFHNATPARADDGSEAAVTSDGDNADGPTTDPRIITAPHLCAPGFFGFTCLDTGVGHVNRYSTNEPVIQDTAPNPIPVRFCQYATNPVTGLPAGCYWYAGKVILDDAGLKVVYTYPSN